MVVEVYGDRWGELFLAQELLNAVRGNGDV
jgi:hypothetical protein